MVYSIGGEIGTCFNNPLCSWKWYIDENPIPEHKLQLLKCTCFVSKVNSIWSVSVTHFVIFNANSSMELDHFNTELRFCLKFMYQAVELVFGTMANCFFTFVLKCFKAHFQEI